MSRNMEHPLFLNDLREGLDQITSGLEKMLSGFATVKAALAQEDDADALEFDPKDPANKQVVGGLEKLTERGVEICYRLFDAGKTRYAVANLMDISFGAASHRQKAWEKVGGQNRLRQPLD